MLLLLSAWQPVWADTSHEMEVWAPIILEVPVRDKVFATMEVLPIWQNNVTDFNFLGLRPALGYRFTPNIKGRVGYIWLDRYNTQQRGDHWIWEELSLAKTVGKVRLESRTRVEHQFIESLNGPAHRFRERLSIEYPLNEQWSAIVRNEFLWILNDLYDGPKQGLSENRLFAGVQRSFNTHRHLKTTWLIGYQLRLIDRQNEANTAAHGIFTVLHLKVR